jgi:ATP-binding cassette subfamily F protein 3
MIILKHLSVSLYGEHLFKDVSFTLSRGERVGLVGPNGSGKSTLLKVILGDVEPDSGIVALHKERIGYVPQELVFAHGETIASFLDEYKHANVPAVLTQVGLGALPAEVPVAQLSGGQKTRLAFAKALLAKPTMLLLDEPTNHLDYEGLEWLTNFLRTFKGGMLIVSHDRTLLDATVTSILEIDPANGAFNVYAGNYSAYVAERAVRLESKQQAYQQQQKEKRRLEERIVLKRQEASLYADPAKGKQIRALEKRLQREVLDDAIVQPRMNEALRSLTLRGAVHSAKLMVRCANVSKRLGSKAVLRNVSFEVRGGEHVCIAGSNGSGKTTLLKLLVGELQADSGEMRIGEGVRVGYFAQEHDTLDTANTVIEEFERVIERGKGLPESEVRKILGRFLFTDQDVFKRVSQLSMGERVRLMFAKLMHHNNELLVLDEPTNHLDIQSREIIEEALSAYKGAIVVVSHDHYFLKKIGVNQIVEL